MATYPAGTVTFLFTDIQGSTRLWERDNAAMRRAVERHIALLGGPIAANGGVHFKTVGDAVQAAFHRPADAVAAAVAGQRAIAAADWPETGPLLVRMALHAGDATPDARGDYLADCLNRLSRLLGAGWGGQVLLTDVVRRQVAAALPPGVTLRDHGIRRLRDLLAPEPIFQLVIEGLPADFPPLKDLESFPNNLPRQPSPLIGRETELTDVASLVTDPTVPLVTLVGPGGTGKTRLALQVGANVLEAFPHGVWFVGLGPVAAGDDVLPTIADALKIHHGDRPWREEQLVTYLKARKLLLILDNFEHLPDEAATAIHGLLGACPDLKVLVTSRRPLELGATERVVPVDPLPTPPKDGKPPPLADLARIEAVALFVQRARAADPRFALTEENAADVADICRRLDGLPLAIELAAAQAGLPPADLRQDLERGLEVLESRRPDLLPHQRALETAIAWSYDRLSTDQQAVFRRLTVFAGGFSRDAAEAIMPAAGPAPRRLTKPVSDLVSNSLLRLDRDAVPTRWTMLESLRTFGRDRLEEANEAEATRRAHAAHFLALVRDAAGHLSGPEQGTWLARLSADHDNLRAGHDWAMAANEATTAVGYVETLWRFWNARGYLSEGRRRVEETIRRFDAADAAGGVKLLLGAGALARSQGDYPAADRWYTQALARARAAGDRVSEAIALNNLGNVALSLGDHRRAVDLYEQSGAVCRALGDRSREAHVLASLGMVAHYLGDPAKAEASYEAALAAWQAAGDPRRTAMMMGNLALLLAPLPERRQRAKELGECCLADARTLNAPAAIAAALTALGIVAEGEGDLARAARYHEESAEVSRAAEDPSGHATALGNLSLAVCDLGDHARAAALACESLATFADLRDQTAVATTVEMLANIARCMGGHRLAARLHGAAAAALAGLAMPLPLSLRARHEASVATLRAELGEADFAAEWAAGERSTVDALLPEVRSLAAAPVGAAAG